MDKIHLDKERCIDCGQCILACSRGLIHREGKNLIIEDEMCNECGHCYAICPSQAISMKNYLQEETYPIGEISFKANPEEFLLWQKSLRSIRHFKKNKVKQEDMQMILEAGRYAPTASNEQGIRFILLERNLDQIKERSFETLYSMAQNLDTKIDRNKYYSKAWKDMYKSYREKKEDPLFFHCPHVLLIVGDKKSSFSQVDAAIAGARMEIQARLMGLGTCYIGFFEKAVENSHKIRQDLGLEEGEELLLSILIGYADISYQRTVPRKPLAVHYL